MDFLAIETFKMPDKNYEMKLIFSGDMIIKLIVEAIEVTLDDQGSPWESKKIDLGMTIYNDKNKNRRKIIG